MQAAKACWMVFGLVGILISSACGPQASDAGLCAEIQEHLGRCFGEQAASVAVAEFCDASASPDLLDRSCSAMAMLVSEQKADEVLDLTSSQTLQEVLVEVIKQGIRASLAAIQQSVGLPSWFEADLSDWRFYICFYRTTSRAQADEKAAAFGRILADHWMQPVVFAMDGDYAVLHHPCALDPQDVDRFSAMVSEVFISHPELFGQYDIEPDGSLAITVQMIAGSQAIPDALGCKQD